MKQSQNFEEWMKRYTANKQNATSPTHGKLYQQKSGSFFGPTVCLLNRNNQCTQFSHTNSQREEELLSKIVLLASLVQSLVEDKKTLERQRQEWYTFERAKNQNQIRELNQKLRTKDLQFQQKYQRFQSKHKKELLELRTQFSTLQIQNTNLTTLLKQHEKQLQKMYIKVKNQEKELQSAMMQSSLMKQSIYVQRSRYQSQAQSNQSLRGRIKRCQEINTDLKFIINGQKQQIHKQKLKQVGMSNMYEIQMDSLRKQLNDVHFEYSKMQEQHNKKWHSQIIQLQNQVNLIEETLKQKCEIIEKQTDIIRHKDNKIQELAKKLQETENMVHSKIIEAKESLQILHQKKQQQFIVLLEERENYELQIQQLNSNLLEMKYIHAQKQLQAQQTINQLLSRIKQKDAQFKKIKLKLKQTQLQPKTITISYSDPLNIDNRLRAQSSLDQILTSFIQLKSSNDRVSKLMQTSFKHRSMSRN